MSRPTDISFSQDINAFDQTGQYGHHHTDEGNNQEDLQYTQEEQPIAPQNESLRMLLRPACKYCY